MHKPGLYEEIISSMVKYVILSVVRTRTEQLLVVIPTERSDEGSTL